MAKPACQNSSDNRWYQVMTTLLYPGVLGTILYALGDAAWGLGWGLFDSITPKGALGLALVLLFTLDYAYTLNDNAQNDYGAWLFLLDICSLVLLFAAGKAILSEPFAASIALPTLMLSVKALAVVYEISRLPKPRVSLVLARSWFRYDSDAAVLLLYLGVFSAWVLLGQALPIWLATVMLVDAALYLKRIE